MAYCYNTKNKGVILRKGIIYSLVVIAAAIGVTVFASKTRTSTTETVTASVSQGSTVANQFTRSEVDTPKTGGLGVNTEVLNVSQLTISSNDLVFFNAPVFDESVDAAISMLEGVSGNTAYLIIHSPGGSVVSGARLLEYMKNSKKKIVTICDNLCASMAFQIFQMGDTRLMTENAIIMAHPASGGAQGTLENMYEMIKAFKLYVDRMDAAVAKRSGIEYSKFKALVADNIWVQTPEALKAGLADGVTHVKINDLFGLKSANNVENNVMTSLRKRGLLTPDKQNLKGYQFN